MAVQLLQQQQVKAGCGLLKSDGGAAAAHLQVGRRVGQVLAQGGAVGGEHIAVAEDQQRALEHARAKVCDQAAHGGMVGGVVWRRLQDKNQQG